MRSILLCDRVLFYALCFLVFFLPASNALVEVLSSVAILFFLLKRYYAGRSGWYSGFPVRSVLIPMLAYFGWSCLSITWSHYPFESLKAFIGKSLQAMFLLFIAYEVLSSLKRVRVFMLFLLIAAGLVSLDGLWQSYSGWDIFVHAPINAGRIMASFKHPNDFGAYLVFLILPVLALVFMTGDNLYKERSLKNVLLVAGSGLFIGIVVTALGLTYSRGAWIGIIFSCVVFMFFARHLWLVILVCAMTFSVIFLPMMAQDRHVSMIADGINSPYWLGGNGRLGFWFDAVRIIYDHPFLGTGLNTYTEVIKDYSESWKAYPHNCYLQMGAELGLTGLVLFLWFLAAVGLEVSRRIKVLPKNPTRWLFAAFFAGWCGVLVHSGLDTTLYSSKLSALLWVMTGALLAFGRQVTEGFYGKK